MAAHLSGEDVAYTGSRSVARLRATDLDVAVLGDPERAEGQVVEMTNPVVGTHRKLVVRDGVIVGATLVGDLSRIGLLTQHYDRRHRARPATSPAPCCSATARPHRLSCPTTPRSAPAPASRPAGSAPAAPWPRSARPPAPPPAAAAAPPPYASSSPSVRRWAPPWKEPAHEPPPPQDPGGRRPRHGRPPLRAGRDRARPHRDPRHRGHRRGAAGGVRPGGPDLLLRGRRRRSCHSCRTAGTTIRGSGCASASRWRASTRRPAPCCWPTARSLAYDELVLATGAAPFVPPVPGHDLDGCFVYRTIEDLEAIRDAAAGATVGAVIGGGLLGLEAANALAQLGLETHVVEMAPRLMAVQVDDAGGATLSRHIEKLGLTVHTGATTTEVLGEDNRVTGLALKDAEPIDAQVVVFSAGIRPRDALARGGRARPRRARRRPGRRALPHLRPARVGDRGVRRPGRADVRPGRPRLRHGRGRRRRAARRRRRLHRRRHVHQAQAARASTSPPSATRTRPPRRARAGLRRRRRRGLQEAGRLRRRAPAPGRRPRRRRDGVRRAAADGRQRHRAPREPRGPDPPGRPGRRRGRAARRGGGLLVQQRQQGGDRRRGRRWLRGRRLRHGLLEGGQHLRVVQAGGEEDRRGVLRGPGQGGRPQPVRALPAHPAGALRRRRGARLHPFRRHRRRPRHRPRLRHLQAHRRLDPGQPAQRARAREDRPGPSRTPTTPTSPTSSATAPTPSSRGSPAARSPPRS